MKINLITKFMLTFATLVFVSSLHAASVFKVTKDDKTLYLFLPYYFLLDLYWTAPELLGSKMSYGTRKGDVYSLAIIISEIGSRNPPYHDIIQWSPKGSFQFCFNKFKPITIR